MNIIEKLGMPKLPTELKVVGDVWDVYKALFLEQPHVSKHNFFHDGKILLGKEIERRGMLEALIKEWEFIESYLASNASRNDGFWYNEFLNRQNTIISIIERATGKTWDEIEELIK